MDAVAQGLFVGTATDAGDESRHSDHGITVVVSLTHSGPDGDVPAIVRHVSVPMKDGPRNSRDQFATAVREVCEALNAGETVLVHCSAGASRSPAVAATALALERDVSLRAAFEQVNDRRAAVEPHDAMIQQAVGVYRQQTDGGTE